jgi:Tfp pilus assembly protein PilZ
MKGLLMDSERRSFDRFQTRFPTKFKDSRADFGSEVFLRDASANGINIITKNRLSMNDRIALEVELPDGNDPLVLSGRVMWSKCSDRLSMWDTGLQFDEVDLMKMQRIFKYNQV